MRAVIQNIIDFASSYLVIPDFKPTDALEIVIISFLIYEVMVWIKDTRSWQLFKGIVMLLVFVMFASIFNLTTILWLAEKTLNVGIIAVIIVFQPELRRALEQIGRKNIFANFNIGDESKNVNEKFSDRTINELIKATYELAKTKTGALVVIEQEVSLSEYERTGIDIDSVISSQLLINIFEHNTPLHDGAVIIRHDRIVSATCYLPLSDNMELSKELGTRHRAGVGVSEVTDSLTIIVSEETGKVAVALEGKIYRNIDGEQLRKYLVTAQNKKVESKRFKIWKGRHDNEKDTVK
ncbi:MAG: diadenylate cyclase CdaA [Lachnospiraceae bacterium]|nr:diadenylate cyclase CdaA [Lachnospiraceae bacterium]MDD6857007.1 diadenylate cyclase CdaA [Lachnospiraceae bacterium]